MVLEKIETPGLSQLSCLIGWQGKGLGKLDIHLDSIGVWQAASKAAADQQG
ncbi:hypothetical protein [Erythrobacter aureus]|uniref:hypothetical protein n=1 Tax=Erythrobacter aureus TaxID=2182384 RepID=UPI003A8D6805